jgi:type IV secretory pathway VirB6-like protein
VGAVFRLWLGITLSCIMLPVVMMLFFPRTYSAAFLR